MDNAKSKTMGDASGKLSNQSLVDLAYEDLQLSISTGTIAEGERLIIDRLARKYGMSLIPVREALVRLCAERFVTFERNKGYRVAPKPSASEIVQLFQARLIIEVGSIETGFDSINDQLITNLTPTNDALKQLGIARTRAVCRKFIELNEHFHVLLVAALGNPFLLDAYNRLGYHQRIMLTRLRDVPDGKRIVKEHADVIRALAARDKKRAVEALRGHIVGGYERFSGHDA